MDNLSRRGFLWLAAVGLAEVACGPIPPTPTSKPVARPTPPMPTAAKPAEIARIVGPVRRPVPTPLSADRVMVLERIGDRATSLAQQSPEYFIDIRGMGRLITAFMKRYEIQVSSAVPVNTVMRINPHLPVERSTGLFEDPEVTIEFHPDFFYLPIDDQVLGMVEGIGSREIYVSAGRRMLSKPYYPNFELELYNHTQTERLAQRPELYFNICGLLEGLKDRSPGYRTSTQRLPYERLHMINNKHQSLYDVYQTILRDINPANRTSGNPLWKEAVSVAIDD